MWKASGWKEERSKSTLDVLEERYIMELNYMGIEDELRGPWILFQIVNPSKCKSLDWQQKQT